MYVISNNYKTYINSSTSRKSKTKIVVNGTEIKSELIKSAPTFSHQATKFIGEFPAKICKFELFYNEDIDLLNNEITVYRGLDINGVIEYIPMGIFKAVSADKIKTNKNTGIISYEGQDRTYKLDCNFNSRLDWSTAHTGLEIIQDVCDFHDIELEGTNFGFANYTFNSAPNFSSATTCREVIRRMAEIGGEIAMFSRSGKLLFKKPTTTNVTISSSKYERMPSKETQFGAITRIVLGHEGYEDDIVYGTTGVDWRIDDNPYCDLVRTEIISTIAQKIVGMSIIPFTLEGVVDDYYLDLNDIITIENKDGTTFNSTILSYDTTSRIRSTIKAEPQEETQGSLVAGTTQKLINEVKLVVNQKTGEIETKVSNVETITNDLKDSISYLTVDLAQSNITIPTDSSNKPKTTKNYVVGYTAKFKGEAITPTVKITGTNTGIVASSSSSSIVFGVNSSSVITNLLNEYTITFTYISEGTTYSIDKKVDIALAVQGEQGEQGKQGIQGEKGEQGQAGQKGQDGITYYTWIKYADSPTSGMSDSSTNKKYIGIAYNKTTSTESTNYSDYNWSLIKGSDGQDGANGKDGTNGKDGVSVTSIVNYYAVNTSNTTAPTTGWSTTLPTRASGQYLWVKELITFSDDTTEYTTAFVVTGDKGEQGIQGATGKDGTSYYFYVRYSANSTGNPMTTTPQSDTKYMGTVSTNSSTAPTSYSSYTWTLIKGADGQGIKGEPGADGESSYLHIKYSNDGVSFTDNDGEDVGSWIGQYVDNIEQDSMTFSDYTWKNFMIDVDQELKDFEGNVENSIQDAVTSTKEEISEKYYNNTKVDEIVREAVTSTLENAEGYTVSFYETVIKSVTDNLAEQIEKEVIERSSAIRMYQDTQGRPVINLGSSESEITLDLRNDGLYILQNDEIVSYFSNNKAYNTDMEVLNSLTIGRFAWKPRANGNLSLVKVGGDS